MYWASESLHISYLVNNNNNNNKTALNTESSSLKSALPGSIALQ